MKLFIKKVQNKGFDVVNYTVFFIYMFICLYPLYYVYINAISDPQMVARGEIVLFPKKIGLGIFLQMFTIPDIGSAIINSILRTVLGTVLALVTSSVAGYIFSKHVLKHRTFWYRYFIITGYVSAGLIPGFLNAVELGFLNSFFWIYIAGALNPPNLVITKTYMESLPMELEEAAYIDGASYVKRFLYVIVPLSKPILAVTAVYAAVGQWNSYMDTIIYMTNGGNQTLQSTLYLYLNTVNKLADAMKSGAQVSAEMAKLTPMALRHAMIAVTLTPIMLVYPFLQKYFAKGIMMGAIKG